MKFFTKDDDFYLISCGYRVEMIRCYNCMTIGNEPSHTNNENQE